MGIPVLIVAGIVASNWGFGSIKVDLSKYWYLLLFVIFGTYLLCAIEGSLSIMVTIFGKLIMTKQILNFEAKALRFSTYRFLSREAHILVFLKQNQVCSTKEVQLATGLSTRGFYLIVKKLELAGLLSITDGQDDKRKRLLRLTDVGLANVDRMLGLVG